MGPMVPLLALIPVFLGAGWLFRSIAVVRGIPLITTGCVLATLAIVGFYPQNLWEYVNAPQQARYRKLAEALAAPPPQPSESKSFLERAIGTQHTTRIPS